MPSAAIQIGRPMGRAVKLMGLLCLAGMGMRMTILAIPPVIPLMHDELRMSETEVGLLVGLPLAMFALAAVPGSLLITWTGARLAIVLGLAITAVAGAARAAAIDVTTLYAATMATGIGVAIMQPSMPTLVREWLPGQIGLGTVLCTAGMLVGATFPPVLTIPYILPLVGGSWRLNLLVWAVPATLIVAVFYLLSPKADARPGAMAAADRRWWPDWNDPLVWLLGLTFGANNASYFTTSAFLGDYVAATGHPGLLGAALAWLNGSQLISLVTLLVLADRLHRQAWPYLIFGPMLLAAFLGMIFVPTAAGIIVASALIGLTTAITLAATLALPALLGAAHDVPRTAAGMFTISYACAIIVPTISGALWDATGRPWTAFAPLCLCAVILTVFGTVLTRSRPAREAGGAATF